MASNGDPGEQTPEDLVKEFETAVQKGTTGCQDAADTEAALERIRTLRERLITRMRT